VGAVASLFGSAIRSAFPALPTVVKPIITPGRDIASGGRALCH